MAEYKKGETDYTFVYDVEIFSNFFSIVFYETIKKEWRDYYFFAGDDYPDCTPHIEKALLKSTLVGFNNLHYDTYLLYSLFDSYNSGDNTGECIQKMHNLSLSIIGGSLGYTLRKARTAVEIDLRSLLRLRRSLKWYSFQMGNVENNEYSGDFNKPLPKEDLSTVLAYNKKDVLLTAQMLSNASSDLDVRYNILNTYEGANKKVLNMDNSAFGAYIICNKSGIKTPYTDKGLRDMTICIGDDIIFDWVKKYKWKSKKLEDSFKRVCGTALHYGVEYKFMKSKGTRVMVHDTKEDKKLSISTLFNGAEVKYGVGGLHYAKPFTFHDGDRIEDHRDKEVVVVDVTSYYPSLITNNKLKPTLCSSKFIRAYKDILEHRKKLDKKTVESYAYKIALNSLFGKMRQAGTVFYDQYMFLRVVVNGQILLTQMMDTIDEAGYEVLVANTDGIFVRINKGERDNLKKIIDKISRYSSLSFDFKTIDKIYIRDCNNFTSYGYGDKGWFATEGLSLHHNISNLASKEATRRFLLDGIPVAETLRTLWLEGKKHWFCFCLANSPATESIEFSDSSPKSRIYIYYISKKGELIKINYKSGVSKYKHTNVLAINIKDGSDMSEYPDFDFYESESKKNIDTFFIFQPNIWDN